MGRLSKYLVILVLAFNCTSQVFADPWWNDPQFQTPPDLTKDPNLDLLTQATHSNFQGLFKGMRGISFTIIIVGTIIGGLLFMAGKTDIAQKLFVAAIILASVSNVASMIYSSFTYTVPVSNVIAPPMGGS
jgi:hypothetical protein